MHHLLVRQETKPCKSCAYGESGHVVFAYLCGYSCLEMQLMKTESDDGFFSYALIDYRNDTPVALNYLGEDKTSQNFSTLSTSEQLRTLDIGRNLARIFIGGSVAAAVYRNSGDVHIPLPMQIDYTDITRVKRIYKMMQSITPKDETDRFENELTSALYTLNNPYIWQSIEKLASRLLEENFLGKGDIEECLEETGLLPLYA